MVTVNLSIPLQPSVLADIHQHYTGQTVAVLGKIAVDIDAVSAAITLTLDQDSLTQQAPVLTVGQAVIIGDEPMEITAADGPQLTLNRGGFPNAPPSTHPTGATVFLLKYSTPWTMLVDEALRPWSLALIQNLGPKSVTLSAAATGAISQ